MRYFNDPSDPSIRVNRRDATCLQYTMCTKIHMYIVHLECVHTTIHVYVVHLECVHTVYPVVDRVDRSSRSNLGQVESIEKSSTRSTFKSSRSSFTGSRVDRFYIDLTRLYIDLTETYKIFGSFRSTDLLTLQ